MFDLKSGAWRRWQAAAGPWRGWAVCPTLSMPSALEPSAAEQALRLDVADLENALRDGRTALVLDIEPVLGARLAAELSRRQRAHAVLVLPRWPHTDAVLPAAELVTVLVRASRHVQAVTDMSNVVFVLDGERQRSIERPVKDARVDNRYALAPGDLPPLAALRQAGIERIVKLTRAA